MTDPNPYITAANQQKAQAADGTGDTQSPQPNYLSDTRPVAVGTQQYQSGGYSGIPSSQNTQAVAWSAFDAKRLIKQMRANDPDQYGSTIKQLRAAGYLGPRSNSVSSVDDAWANMVTDAAELYAANPGTTTTVFDFLYASATSGKKPPGAGGSRSGGGGSPAYNGPVARTDLTNQFDAHVILNNALAQYLGRQATDKELAAFKEKLNATEAANPTVATPVGHNAVQSGGVNPRDVARSYAMSQGDYAETQASTTLMGWLGDALTKAKNERIV